MVAPDKRRAAAQLALIGILIAGIAAVAIFYQGRPAESTALRIPVSELRSQAAELALLERDFQSGKLDRRFVVEQASQLRRISASSYRELGDMRVVPELSAMQAKAVASGLELERTFGRFTESEPPDLAEVEALDARLQQIEQQLQP